MTFRHPPCAGARMGAGVSFYHSYSMHSSFECAACTDEPHQPPTSAVWVWMPFTASTTSSMMSMICAPPMIVRMREACPGQSTRVNCTASYLGKTPRRVRSSSTDPPCAHLIAACRNCWRAHATATSHRVAELAVVSPSLLAAVGAGPPQWLSPPAGNG